MPTQTALASVRIRAVVVSTEPLRSVSKRQRRGRQWIDISEGLPSRDSDFHSQSIHMTLKPRTSCLKIRSSVISSEAV